MLMRRIYSTKLSTPQTRPDKVSSISFIAAHDGKYEFSGGRLYKRTLIPDHNETITTVEGFRFVLSHTRWTKRNEVGCIPPVHVHVKGNRRSWTINSRMRIIEEEMDTGRRVYIESSYDIDDPGFIDLVKDYVQGRNK